MPVPALAQADNTLYVIFNLNSSILEEETKIIYISRYLHILQYITSTVFGMF
jgi:hypothetical protein